MHNVVMICDYTLRDQMVIENYGISVTTKLSAMQCKSDKVTYAVITEPSQRRKLGIAYHDNIRIKSCILVHDGNKFLKICAAVKIDELFITAFP
mgnify:CR=1 FL=1